MLKRVGVLKARYKTHYVSDVLFMKDCFIK